MDDHSFVILFFFVPESENEEEDETQKDGSDDDATDGEKSNYYLFPPCSTNYVYQHTIRLDLCCSILYQQQRWIYYNVLFLIFLDSKASSDSSSDSDSDPEKGSTFASALFMQV